MVRTFRIFTDAPRAVDSKRTSLGSVSCRLSLWPELWETRTATSGCPQRSSRLPTSRGRIRIRSSGS